MSEVMKPYIFDRDDDGHWYLIPKEKHAEFVEADDDKINNEFWDYAIGGNPNMITVYLPEVRNE